MPGETRVAQVRVECREVLLHQRLQRGVDDARRGAPVLAHDRVELVREREGHVRQRLGDQLADAQLVGGVDDRPEQADPDRLHLEIPAALERGATHSPSSSGMKTSPSESIRSSISKVR